ncbi:MAG: hypothetical protein BGO28_06575 [Alphaproteobacteria bacterium 43-37]|nr:MAG: hypothetical protein BGO28_06575 [Alphaproteobacteria bacterium 43-37]
MKTYSHGKSSPINFLTQTIKLSRKEKKAIGFVLSLPKLAQKIIGAPMIAQTIWKSKICISHENGPNPMDHPESIWITQCWKNVIPFFPAEVIQAIKKSSQVANNFYNGGVHSTIAHHAQAIVNFYNYAQKMRKEMNMNHKNPS